jgi:hypothetical protein
MLFNVIIYRTNFHIRYHLRDTVRTRALDVGGDGGVLAPPTFHLVSGKILSYGPKNICQILTDSFLPAIFCKTVCIWLSAKLRPFPLLKTSRALVKTKTSFGQIYELKQESVPSGRPEFWIEALSYQLFVPF